MIRERHSTSTKAVPGFIDFLCALSISFVPTPPPGGRLLWATRATICDRYICHTNYYATNTFYYYAPSLLEHVHSLHITYFAFTNILTDAIMKCFVRDTRITSPINVLRGNKTD